MLESRNVYGWGVTGAPGKGFDWRLTKGKQSLVGGECKKSELSAKRAANDFLRECELRGSDYWKGAKVEIIPYTYGYEY